MKLLLLFVLIAFCNSTYFLMEEGREYCFNEYLFGKQYLLIKYKSPILDGRLREAMLKFTELVPNHSFGISAKIYNPNYELYRETFFDQVEGGYEFQSIENLDGNYEICFRTNTTHGWFSTSMIEFHVDFKVYENEPQLKETLPKDKIEKVNSLLVDAFYTLEVVKHELEYTKIRESQFRNTTDTIDSRLIWVHLLIFVTLLSVTIWQLWTLRNYFKIKKLI